MKKRISRTRVNAKKSHSDQMLISLLLSLLSHGTVTTTRTRAKMLKRFADKELSYTIGLTGPMLKNRLYQRNGNKALTRALLLVNEFAAIEKLTSGGGYVSIIKVGYRAGDNAEVSEVGLIARQAYLKFVASKAPKPKKKVKKIVKPKDEKKIDVKVEEKKAKEQGEKVKTADIKPRKKLEKKPAEKTVPKKQPVSAKPEEQHRGFLSRIGDRILGRRVQGPIPGKQRRSTARSGL